MKKRILSLLLCLVMVVGLLPVTAQAADMDMSAYTGKRITHVEVTAFYHGPDDSYSENKHEKDSYAESRITAGEKAKPYLIQFVPTSFDWVQNSTSGTVDAKEGGTAAYDATTGIGWKDVVKSHNKIDYLKTTDNTQFPLYASGEIEWRSGTWSNGAPKWEGLSDLGLDCYPNGQYRYRLALKNMNSAALTDYRLDPDVTVTVTWYNSEGKKDNFTLNTTSSDGIHNETHRSSAEFVSPEFTAKVNSELKLVACDIPESRVGEAIQPIDLAEKTFGGTAPYRYEKLSNSSSSLGWLSVSSDGKITGTPRGSDDVWDSRGTRFLEVKVTDSVGGTATAKFKVDDTLAAYIVIDEVVIGGLDYPCVGDDAENTQAYVVSAMSGSTAIPDGTVYIPKQTSYWLSQDSLYKAAYKDNFATGMKYKYKFDLRMDSKDRCEKYKFADSLTVTVEGLGGITFTRVDSVNEGRYAYVTFETNELTATSGLTGTVSYSGAARYGATLTAKVTGAPEGATLNYRWQVKDGSEWKNISGAPTTASYYISADNAGASVVNKEIRVKVTATNYAGTLYGASKKVTKDVAPGAPAVTQLTVTPVMTDNKATVTIGNYYETVKYVYTTTPVTSGWPTGTDIGSSSFEVTMTEAPQTIYVYAWYEETDTREGGVYYSGASALIPGTTAITSARDMVYPDYDSKTPTIYLKKGEQITVRYQLDPNNANDNLPQWKETYTATDSTGASVSVTNDPTTKTLTITAGNETGTVDVVAYKDVSATYPDPWTYGAGGDSSAGRKITVKIYDPSDLANVPFTKTYFGTTELYVDDTYEITKAGLLDLPFVPDGVEKNNYTLAAKFTTYGTGGSSGVITRSDTNDFVSLSNDAEKFVIKGNAVTDSSVYVEFFALPNEEIEVGAYGSYAIAALNVTVKARPTVLDLSITPPVLTLQAGKTYQLVATKTPAGAAGDITWSSDNESVATVTRDASDSSKATVTVSDTATAGTTVTITARYGDGTTALTANCIITVAAACGENHAYVYQEKEWGHVKVCLFCGDSDNKILDHDLFWKESAENPGKMYGECIDCGYKTDLMNIPANETIKDPDSSSGGHHSGAGRPYRPGLSAAAPGGTTTAAVQSPKTGDAGIMLYAALSLMSMTGGAWLVSKKRRDR